MITSRSPFPPSNLPPCSPALKMITFFSLVCVCVSSCSVLIEPADLFWFCLYMGLRLTILHWTTNKGAHHWGEAKKISSELLCLGGGTAQNSLSLLMCPLFWAYFLQSLLGETCVTTDLIVFWLLCLLFVNIPSTTGAGAVVQMCPLGLSTP